MRSGQISPTGPARLTEQLLAELEEALTAQLSCLQRDDFDGAQLCGRQAEDIIAQIDPKPVVAGTMAEQLGRLRLLYRKLCLGCAATKDELAEQLARARTGKTALKAYRHIA